MTLRHREYLTEGLSNLLDKFPAGTDLKDMRGIEFSSWGGKLALVVGPSYSYASDQDFDVDLMARRYAVRFAIDPKTKKPLNAPQWALGREAHVLHPNKPYEQTTFEMNQGSFGGQWISGGFSKINEFYVKVKLKDLYPTEVRVVVDQLRNKYDFIDVSRAKLGPKDWEIALKHSTNDKAFDALKKVSLDKANAFDNFIYHYDINWTDEGVGGVFATTNKGTLKFIIDRP